MDALTAETASIRIVVTGAGDDIDRQTRAYAEYRLFSRLVPAREQVGHALVALRGGGAHGTPRCAITIALRNGELRTADARAAHIYDRSEERRVGKEEQTRGAADQGTTRAR